MRFLTEKNDFRQLTNDDDSEIKSEYTHTSKQYINSREDTQIN